MSGLAVRKRPHMRGDSLLRSRQVRDTISRRVLKCSAVDSLSVQSPASVTSRRRISSYHRNSSGSDSGSLVFRPLRSSAARMLSILSNPDTLAQTWRTSDSPPQSATRRTRPVPYPPVRIPESMRRGAAGGTGSTAHHVPTSVNQAAGHVNTGL